MKTLAEHRAVIIDRFCRIYHKKEYPYLGARVVALGERQFCLNADVFGMWGKTEFGWIDQYKLLPGASACTRFEP